LSWRLDPVTGKPVAQSTVEPKTTPSFEFRAAA
jgi:hypothetical protein